MIFFYDAGWYKHLHLILTHKSPARMECPFGNLMWQMKEVHNESPDHLSTQKSRLAFRKFYFVKIGQVPKVLPLDPILPKQDIFHTT